MNDQALLDAIAIRTLNSGDFVARVLEAQGKGQVVILESGLELPVRPRFLHVVEKVTPRMTSGWHSFLYTESSSESPAQISFTSGTTGVPKGIVISHRALLDVVQRLNSVMELTSDVREYVGIPVNYSFGFGRCRATASVGGSCYLPPSGFNPLEIAEMARQGEINAISAVPTQWRSIIQNPGLIGEAGRQIRWIEIGSQLMTGAEKHELRTLFPNARIVQHYGLTEASRTTFLDISQASLDQLDSVGRAVGETEIEISETGRIRTRGPHVAIGQLTDRGIEPLVDEEGWLETNDLGHIRDGMLYFDGRADDLINCGGIKVPSELFESKLLDSLGLDSGVGVGPIRDPLLGELVLVVVEDSAGVAESRVRDATADVAEEFGIKSKGAVLFARCAQLPRTSTGKLKRRELGGFATRPSPAPAVSAPPASAGESAPAPDPAAQESAERIEAQIITAWQEVLGTDTISRDASFFELGGDSLSAINAILRMEALRVDRSIARKLFDGRTINEIASELRGSGPSQSAPASPLALGANVINTVRGFLVLLVISVHWLPGVWGRLPAIFSHMDYYLRPVYRFGTPGFALVFGLGLSFFQIPIFQNHPRRYVSIVKRNLLVLGIGILILAIFKYAGESFTEDLKSPGPSFAGALYSVLLFYFVMVLASPLLLRIVTRSSNLMATCLLITLGSFIGWELALHFVSQTPTTGILEVVRLMLVAYYNVFRMTGMVFLGAAIGCSYRQRLNSVSVARDFFLTSLLVIGFSVLFAHRTVGLGAWASTSGTEPWTIGVYTGVLLLLIATLHSVYRSSAKGTRVFMPLLHAFAVMGILALPAYVLHEIVLPAKTILYGVGLPRSVAIAIPVSLCVLALGYMGTRIYKVYFGAKLSATQMNAALMEMED